MKEMTLQDIYDILRRGGNWERGNIPSSECSVLYLYTSPVDVKPPFSGGSRIRSIVRINLGSLGPMKNTSGAIRIEESR
jgi:hypothetical protein